MANQEHLDILKQGVEVWNRWRREHTDFKPNLSGADLSFADLRGADLGDADLQRVNLQRVNLQEANLQRADLSFADLRGADLGDAVLNEAILIATFLDGANLSGVGLGRTNLTHARLRDTNLSGAAVFWTVFGNVELSRVKGLETVGHSGPSIINIDTFILSKGRIPEIFLRRAGVPPSIIEAIPSLVGSLEPIQYYTCFISYSGKDQDFAERLYADLQSKGVRCWFAPEDMDIGDKIRPRIEESIRRYDKLLLVLSEHSIASKWVAYEVERALNKEPEGVPNVLYPVRLDDTVMQLKAGWADDIRRTRHIGDFTQWKNHDAYQKAFTRLLRALKAGTKKTEEP